MDGKIPASVANSSMNELVKNRLKSECQSRIEQLNIAIRQDLCKETDPLRQEVLRAVLNMSSYGEENYQAKLFVYNDGKFRTIEEIERYNENIQRRKDMEWRQYRMEENRKYYASGQYDRECSEGKWRCWLPFGIDVGLFILSLFDLYNMFDLCLWTVILSPVALAITAICLSLHAKKCENLAQEHCVPRSSPTYQRAVNTRNTLQFGAVIGALTSYNYVSKSVKSTLNPDTWGKY